MHYCPIFLESFQDGFNIPTFENFGDIKDKFLCKTPTKIQFLSAGPYLCIKHVNMYFFGNRSKDLGGVRGKQTNLQTGYEYYRIEPHIRTCTFMRKMGSFPAFQK